MTPAALKTIAFRCLAVSLLLLMAAQSGMLLRSVDLPSEALLHLSILTGLLGGGLYAAATVEPNARSRNPVLRVWAVGLIVSLIGGLLRLVAGSEDVSIYIGYPLAAIALGYWLIGRFSTVWAVWQRESLYVVSVLMALAGVLLVLSRWVAFIGNVALFAVPLLLLIVMAHGYRALSSRNDNATLAPHWYTLALLLWLLGEGLVGSLRAQPEIHTFTAGTQLEDAQSLLAMFAPLCVILGAVNQIGAELHGQNGRITGYVPFWLVAFGVIGTALAFAAAGLVQAYLRALTPMTAVQIDAALHILSALRRLGELTIASGVGIYGLSFWIRRPPKL